jgi:hypothetical protein
MAEPSRHIRYLELYNNGVEYECLVLREFENGDIAYIKLNELDRTDLDRLAKIVYRRGANNFPLWDLLDQNTLQNGMNALKYFDQMVMVKTTRGEIIPPRSGGRGTLTGTGVRQARPEPVQPYPGPQPTVAPPSPEVESKPIPVPTQPPNPVASSQDVQSTVVKKGPGRPRKG